MPRRSASFYEEIRGDTLAAYLHRIVHIPLLSKDEELDLGRQIQRGDERAVPCDFVRVERVDECVAIEE